VLDGYPKRLKLVFKNFPLNRHRFARKAATAALAAHAQGKFWEFHGKLFENRNLNDARIREIAQEVGLDMEKFPGDMQDPGLQKLINRDIFDGREAGVRGIPTVFINGKLLGTPSLEGFREMIDSELNKDS
jgi:protein-disulfide isomerase